MRKPSMIGGLLASLLFAQSLPAQSSDWNVVRSISSGAIITVGLRRGPVHCTLASVTQSELVCYRDRRSGTTSNYTIPRSDITQVRRESRSGTKLAIGIGIGAGAGAGIGASVDTRTAQKSAMGAVVGMLGGALVGLIVARTISHRGIIVYQR